MDVRAGVGPEHIAKQTVRWDRAGTFNVADGLHRGQVRREAAVDATGREKEERGSYKILFDTMAAGGRQLKSIWKSR